MAASEDTEHDLTLLEEPDRHHSDADELATEPTDAEAEIQRQMEEIERAIQLRRHELELKTREREREQRRRELEAQLEERKRMLEHLTRVLEDESIEVAPKPVDSAADAATVRKPELVASVTVENLLRTVDSAITDDDERREFNEASEWMFEVSRVRLKYDDMTTDARKLLIDRYYKTTGTLRRAPFIEKPPSAIRSLPVKSSTFGVAEEPAPLAASENPMNVAFQKGYLKDPEQILAKTMKGSLGAPSADIPIHFSKLKGIQSRSTTDVRR